MTTTTYTQAYAQPDLANAARSFVLGTLGLLAVLVAIVAAVWSIRRTVGLCMVIAGAGIIVYMVPQVVIGLALTAAYAVAFRPRNRR